MTMQGVVKPAPGLDFTSKPDVRLGSIADDVGALLSARLSPEALAANLLLNDFVGVRHSFMLAQILTT